MQTWIDAERHIQDVSLTKEIVEKVFNNWIQLSGLILLTYRDTKKRTLLDFNVNNMMIIRIMFYTKLKQTFDN
jgi:hypothetical protein